MTSAFERHGLDHLSASSINLFVAQPAMWAMQKLLGHKSRVGPVVTFNAGNLVKVAERLVAAFPRTRFVVAGDDDRHKQPNVGREAAAAAARVLRCEVVFPVLPEGHLGTDFNDMAQLCGHEAVACLFAAGEDPDVFETLIPLDPVLNREVSDLMLLI